MSVHLKSSAKRFMNMARRDAVSFSYVFVYYDLYQSALRDYLSGQCKVNLVHRAKARLYKEIEFVHGKLQ